ncbi:peptidylprolyl isomerase [Roseivivax sp. THAF30]|uniref:peptidylprolyl isomerase n=1 Tax=Roseivivax sp. THAF30 TaxID=2587852 RepID=UPI001269680E|nr:peptidylprolyl isomerase [Roseivivax sp. THAF30]QFT64630.1 putative parvulin-type peptidyl-prolyl cis-trans isomerase precursor [Roseivivax sp. THAF30]
MSRPSLKLTAVAALLAFAGPAWSQDETAGSETAPDADLSEVVATVNGEEITLGHMIMVRAGLPEQYQQLPPDVLFEGILDQLIQQEALAQSDSAEETTGVRLTLENERRALLASEAVAGLSRDAVSEEDIQNAYDEQFGNEGGATEYNAAHILVETEEEAQALIEELNGGADFATLAQERSTGPSGANGGDLGWFAAGQMVQPFQDAVETLEPGAISEPVETQFGWHVVKLNETRQQEAPALEEVRDQIEQQLAQARVEAAIEELVAGSEVTRPGEDLDPAVLGRTDLLMSE